MELLCWIAGGFFVATIVLGYLVARHLHGWLILAGFVAIAAVWLSYVYSQASDADADGQILALVVFGIPAAAALAGWAVGTIVGRIVKAAATEASPAFALTPP